MYCVFRIQMRGRYHCRHYRIVIFLYCSVCLFNAIFNTIPLNKHDSADCFRHTMKPYTLQQYSRMEFTNAQFNRMRSEKKLQKKDIIIMIAKMRLNCIVRNKIFTFSLHTGHNTNLDDNDIHYEISLWECVFV